MNIISRNNITKRYESFWRNNKTDNTRDTNGNIFPWPKHVDKQWNNQNTFLEKLKQIEEYLSSINRFSKENIRECLLCDQKHVSDTTFNLNNIIWNNGLSHYIKMHNIKPSDEFMDIIYKYITVKSNKIVKYKSDIYEINNMRYLKLERNQIYIMDALMKHGGYTRKYIDKKDRKIYRYSEHTGLLDFNNSGLDRILISGKTNRVDKDDNEIYLPKNMPDAIDYEYLFHTHPPTPKPGGRSILGILYEFPSVSDIYHFIDHFNDGLTQGSLVIAPEGMYNIRKLVFDRKKIKIDEDQLYDELKNVMKNVQDKALKKYGTKFSTYTFYSKIAQDTSHIDSINDILNKFKLHIDFYPRMKDAKGKWYIDSIYLPIFVINRIDKKMQ
jgi:hypothetical protein